MEKPCDYILIFYLFSQYSTCLVSLSFGQATTKIKITKGNKMPIKTNKPGVANANPNIIKQTPIAITIIAKRVPIPKSPYFLH